MRPFFIGQAVTKHPNFQLSLKGYEKSDTLPSTLYTLNLDWCTVYVPVVKGSSEVTFLIPKAD